jgi:hypothetical protein
MLTIYKHLIAATALLAGLTFTSPALAAISFGSATNGATLVNTIDDNGTPVFVIGGVASGDSTTVSFAIDSTCPGLIMTGGAEFSGDWSCAGGTISATLISRGGLSFGPGSPDNAGTFYVSFGDAPAPPGASAPPSELSGIKIAVFGDVNRWDMTGEQAAGGARFGVELSGNEGGSAYFRLDLPAAAVNYLGGVLGVFVGGKADPFSAVVNNDDGSASLRVDIARLSSSSSSSGVSALARTVTKKITTGARSVSFAFKKTSVKRGGNVAIAMCAGSTFTAGDKVKVKFTIGGKAARPKATFTLGASGCATSSVAVKNTARGTMTGQVVYKGKKGKGTIKVS